MVGLLKQGISRAARSSAFAGFVGLLDQFGDSRTNLLRVLTYHRIDESENRPSLYPGLVSTTPTGFHEQIDFLHKNYHVLCVEEICDRLKNNTQLPPRSVLITFDDAYRDFAEHAWPILQQFKLPVTLFVPTDYPDQPAKTFWWDRLYQAVLESARTDEIETPIGRLALRTWEQRRAAYRGLTHHLKSVPHDDLLRIVAELCTSLEAPPAENHVLGWEALRRLAKEGVTLAPHTRTHPLLNRVSLDEARDEALGSLHDLQREIGTTPPVLAYPAGGFTAAVADMLREAGFLMAFTTRRGINNLAHADLLALRRINIGLQTTEAMIRAQLHPWLSYASRWL